VAGGLIALAAGLPFVVTTRWYDFYYWPKIVALYAATALLTLAVVHAGHDRWVRAWQTAVGAALAAWLVALALATAFSVEPLLSLVGADYRYDGLLTWLAYAGVLALAATTLTTIARLRTLVAALLTAAAVMAVLGLLQRWGFQPVPEDVSRADLLRTLPRAWGTTGSPLAMGAYLVLLLPIPLGLYAWAPTGGRRLVYGGVVVLLYAALVGTLARAAWVAFVVGLVAWATVTGAARLRRAAVSLLILGLACAAVTPVVLAGPAADYTSLTIGQVRSSSSTMQRMFLWRTTTPLVWKRPVLGWGPETLAEIYPAYHDPEFVRLFPEARMQHVIVDRPHNDLLQQAISTGLVGLAVYVWLWGALLWTAWRVARGSGATAASGSPAGPAASVLAPRSLRSLAMRKEEQMIAVLASGLLGGLVGYLVQLQFSFSYVSVAPVFWVLAGTLVALTRLQPGRR
jgi:O-antigen ligase